jgi:hypothetical protein
LIFALNNIVFEKSKTYFKRGKTMSRIIIILILITAILSVATAFVARDYENALLQAVLQCLAILPVITAAILCAIKHTSFSGWLFVAGIIVALLSDVLLIENLFWDYPTNIMIGMGSFIIMYGLYGWAFSRGRPHPFTWFSPIIFAPYIVYGLFIYFILFPGLEAVSLKAGVAMYTVAMLVMVSLAMNRFIYFKGKFLLLAAVGGIILLIEETVLSITLFRPDFCLSQLLLPYRDLICGILYTTAQWLIIGSIMDENFT